MTDWATVQANVRARHSAGPTSSPGALDGHIRLDALGGPSETMQAAGLTNRGSLAYAMRERGFPQPVKVLRGIRLWDLGAVKQWTTNQNNGRIKP